MLYDELIKIRNKNKIPFHMPGSKGGAAIDEKYRRDTFALDFTELADTDNLAQPEGILRKAQEKAAEIYGSARSFFMVNGSSGGILAAFHYLSQKSKKIIIDRNCHISVMNAVGLFGITPVFVIPEAIAEWGIPGEISPEAIEKAIINNKGAGAVFLTSPNYYGISSDLKKIYEICRKYNILLCVDSAHGAHFNFSKRFVSASICSDISVMSVHKTLPAPTQTAIMNVSDRIDFQKIKKSINIFQTTSPSYIFMAYIDYAIRFMSENGERIFEEIFSETEKLKKLLGENMLDLKNKDFSRIVVKGGTALADYLYNNFDISVEMSDLNTVVCIAGYGNTKEDFEKLGKGILSFYKKSGASEVFGNTFEMSDMSAKSGGKKILIPLEKAEGYRAGEQIVPYPPGVAVITEGELITKAQIDSIKKMSENGISILGLSEDNYLCVFDKN